MKFILQEDKFILNENKRFLLEERFNLTEATAAELAQKWTIQFLKTFDNTEAVLNKYIEYASLSKDKDKTQRQLNTWATNLKEATEDFEIVLRQPLADITADFASAKNGLKACLDVLVNAITVFEDEKNSITTSTENLVSLKKVINPLNTLYSATTWSATNVTKLKQLIEKVKELGARIFDSSALEADSANVQKFKEDCTDCLELLTELKAKLPVDTDFTKFSSEDLATYQAEVKRLIDSVHLKEASALNKGLVIANFTLYWEQVQTLKTGYSTISNLSSLNPKSMTIDLDTTATDRKDWKSKLAGAVKKDTVIQEFIYTTWPKSAADVLKIKDTLLPECEAYGFEAEGDHKNPFISFISEVYLKYRGLVTPEKYNAIHNLVADNKLTGKDLAGEGDMGLGNLVFCKALYSLDAKVIKLYVRKQYNLLKAATKDDRFKTNAELAFNALYSLTEIATGDATKNSVSLSLRPMTDIEQLEAKWTGEVSDTAEADSNKKKIATNAELIRQINTTENAIKVLVALAIKFSSNDKIVALAQSCKEAQELMSKTTTLEAIRKLVASVERLYKIESITATQALSLAKSILESDQFTLTLE
jgi:hypothetical protein